MWNMTKSRYIHREKLERLSPFFPFHIDTVKSITSKLFWFCFSFSFLLPSIILKFPHLWKIKMEESLACVTLQALERLFKVPTATSSRNIWKCKRKFVCVGRGACSAFILLSPVLKTYLTLLKFQSNQTVVIQRFTRISFKKLCRVRQNNVQRKALIVADSGYLHWSPNTKEHQEKKTLPKYSQQQWKKIKKITFNKPHNLCLTVSPPNWRDLVKRNTFETGHWFCMNSSLDIWHVELYRHLIFTHHAKSGPSKAFQFKALNTAHFLAHATQCMQITPWYRHICTPFHKPVHRIKKKKIQGFINWEKKLYKWNVTDKKKCLKPKHPLFLLLMMQSTFASVNRLWSLSVLPSCADKCKNWFVLWQQREREGFMAWVGAWSWICCQTAWERVCRSHTQPLPKDCTCTIQRTQVELNVLSQLPQPRDGLSLTSYAE